MSFLSNLENNSKFLSNRIISNQAFARSNRLGFFLLAGLITGTNWYIQSRLANAEEERQKAIIQRVSEGKTIDGIYLLTQSTSSRISPIWTNSRDQKSLSLGSSSPAGSSSKGTEQDKKDTLCSLPSLWTEKQDTADSKPKLRTPSSCLTWVGFPRKANIESRKLPPLMCLSSMNSPKNWPMIGMLLPNQPSLPLLEKERKETFWEDITTGTKIDSTSSLIWTCSMVSSTQWDLLSDRFT